MKKSVYLLASALFLSACSTPAVKQKEIDYSAINNIQKVEIFYYDEVTYGIVDGGGSGAVGLAGIFGPIGLIVAAAAHGVSKVNVIDRMEERSKEFTKTIKDNINNPNYYTEFVNAFADKLRLAGKEVKITTIPRGKHQNAQEEEKEIVSKKTDGYSPLVFKVFLGYSAQSATSSFYPFMNKNYYLLNANNNRLIESNYIKKDFDESYLTYQGLLNDHKKSAEALRKGLLAEVDIIYQEIYPTIQANEKTESTEKIEKTNPDLEKSISAKTNEQINEKQ